MKLRRVRKGQWDVLAMCGPRGECPLLDFLAGLEAHLEADGRAMLRVLGFAAEHGPPRNVEASHKIAGEIERAQAAFDAYQKAKKAGNLKVEGYP